jgi:hypothetical protein
MRGTEVRELLSETQDVAFVNACRALAHLLQRTGCRDEDSASAMARDPRDSKARGETDDEL